MSSILAVPGLTAASYQRNALHAPNCIWTEKNCYIDVWIEVIHALGLDPRVVLQFTAAIDFEGDQWTFFKPPHGELRDVYGIDVQELNVWRPLIEHARHHLAAGRLIATEADAWWLPDTSGTDYRRMHTKSTIVLAELDTERQRLGYFHNAGYFMLEGEDFVQTFHLHKPHEPEFMPMFAELVHVDGIVRRTNPELIEHSIQLWKRHLRRVPKDNPIERFATSFPRQLEVMQANGLAYYHAWAFATTRQLGAAFELAGANLRWMRDSGATGLDGAIEAFDQIASLSKAFILKGARAVNARRALDGSETFGPMAKAWRTGIDSLSAKWLS